MAERFSFYNSLTRSIDEFVPRVPSKVSMYTCGPTVYHYAHIGNIRTYIMQDVLIKALEYAGYSVKRVMNITDVGHLSSDADTGEDKMLAGAKREHKTVMEIAKFYTDAFFTDFDAVGNKRPDVVEPATNCIPEFIHMVEVLLEKGFAYVAGGNVYFDTSKLDDYYVFSSDVEKEQLQVGVRDDVEEDTNKKNKTDFVLWFTKSKFEDQALKWDSPWGVGYPGWHIECSCISMKHLGEFIDIHCGGVDNIFPHHTNEIAQSESYLGHERSGGLTDVMRLRATSCTYSSPFAQAYSNTRSQFPACDEVTKIYMLRTPPYLRIMLRHLPIGMCRSVVPSLESRSSGALDTGLPKLSQSASHTLNSPSAFSSATRTTPFERNTSVRITRRGASMKFVQTVMGKPRTGESAS